MKRITFSQRLIVQYLIGKDWTTVTNIKNALFTNEDNTATSVNKISDRCRILCRSGWLVQNSQGRYKVSEKALWYLDVMKQAALFGAEAVKERLLSDIGEFIKADTSELQQYIHNHSKSLISGDYFNKTGFYYHYPERFIEYESL